MARGTLLLEGIRRNLQFGSSEQASRASAQLHRTFRASVLRDQGHRSSTAAKSGLDPLKHQLQLVRGHAARIRYERIEMVEVLKIRAPGSASDLDSLAKQIDAAHVEVGAALLTSVQRAAEVGHLLAQAKEQVPHGQWETWVEQNTAVSPRTARGYMQAARYWTEADKAKRRALADLGLQGALAEIARPRSTPAVEPGDSAAAPMMVRCAVEEVDRSGVIKIVTTEMPSEDPGRVGDPKQDQLAATMKSIREAEERSATRRVIMGDSIQSRPDLDGINREWDKLDQEGRDKFLSEKLLTHGHPNHWAEIIDVAT